MANNQSNNSPNQEATAGRDAQQINGNYTNTSTNNINLLVPVLLVGVLALAGLSWALVFGQNNGGQTPQVEQQKSPPNPVTETSP